MAAAIATRTTRPSGIVSHERSRDAWASAVWIGTGGGWSDFVSASGIENASVLEIGGGIGELHVELLRRGARAATNLEISTSYEAEAARLLDGSGFEDRVTRRFLDAGRRRVAGDDDSLPTPWPVVDRRGVRATAQLRCGGVAAVSTS
jgi:hypothetical protein